MDQRDTLYRLSDIVELDGAFIGGKHPGKRGCGAEGKTPILIACETFQGQASFVAMEAMGSILLSFVNSQFQKRCNRFGPEYAREPKQRQSQLGNTWYLD